MKYDEYVSVGAGSFNRRESDRVNCGMSKIKRDYSTGPPNSSNSTVSTSSLLFVWLCSHDLTDWMHTVQR